MGIELEEANNLFLRSTLMIAIEDIIQKNGWTHNKAAEIIGVARPRITELLGSRIDLFGIDTLVKYLNRLGKTVSFSVSDSNAA
jgi:predicted XRE-type DNA-binding protein